MSLTFAIGDIHGCIDPLKRMIARIEAKAESGTVVFLGDYVDRGPDSRAVIDLVMAGPQRPDWRWITLKGNHEDLMIGARDGRHDESRWLAIGGLETLKSYGGTVSAEHLAWAAGLPLVHSDEHRIFVHGGVRDGLYLEDQTPDDLMWTRFGEDQGGEFWGKHLVHGHTPSEANPRTVGNRTNVDSGCVFGGRLSAAVFDDGVAGGPIDFIEVKA